MNWKEKMSKRYYLLTIRGKTTEYCFTVIGDEKYLDEWRKEGIDIDPLEHDVPKWAVDMGLFKVWCWLQDLGFLRP
jgi:hypothetical protein